MALPIICSLVPLCCGDVVSFEDVKQCIFVIQLELQLLSRPVLLLSQEETQQGLALQRRDILHREITAQSSGKDVNLIHKARLKQSKSAPKNTQIKRKIRHRSDEYLAGGVGVQDFIFNDEPQPLPLLFVAF